MFWLGIIIGVIGAWLFREMLLGYPATPSGIKTLGRKSYAVVRAIGEALLPPGGAIPISAEEANVPEFIDNYVATVPKLTGRLMLMLFFLMEHATYFFAFTTRRLSEMDVEERIKYLEGWEDSSLYPRRLAFTGLRAIYGMAYLGHPEVEAAMGFRMNDNCREALLIERSSS